MSEMRVVERYFDAWNQHNPQAIVDCFLPDGRYQDPAVPQGVSGDDLASYARRLFTSMPDFHLEILDCAETLDGRVIVEWQLQASAAVRLPGIDVLTVERDLLHSAHVYYDRRTSQEQSGSDSWSQRVSSEKLTPPGAFSLTWIQFSLEDVQRERALQYGPRIGMDMMKRPGALTWMTAGIKERWFTITAWETVEDVRKAMSNNPVHQEAVRQFFRAGFGQAVHSSVWVPHYIGSIWVRCPSCRQVSDYQRAQGHCPCGKALPSQPSYW